MQYSQAKQGRVFILRLEDQEVIHTEIEKFARAHGIQAATVMAVGAIDAGSRLVVGPVDKDARPVEKRLHILETTREITGTGTLFPDESGRPMLHMHLACGFDDKTVTGCIREGVVVWQVVEVIITELLDCSARHLPDAATGFKLLKP